ncbi:MAG: PAS domain-containing protein, partial [Chitinophagaceae bacterium]
MVVNQLHKIHLVNLLTADSDNLFASVLQLIQQVTRFPYTVIAIEKQGSLWLKSTFNDKIQEVNAQKTFTEYIINNNEPLAVDNINAHELFSNYLTYIRNLVSLNSFIGYPLRDSNGNAYGIIAAFDIEIQPSVHKLIPALQSIANHTQQIFCSQLQKLNSTPQIANFHQQFLNSIIYNKKGGLLVSLDEKGNYLAFTQAYIAFTEKKWGISPLVGEPFSGHLFADNQQEWEQLFIKSLHKQELVFEWSFHTIQKQLIHLQFQVFTYYSTDGQSKNVAVFLTDISTLKNVELALQKQQNLLKQAELISKMGSWEVNLEKKTARFSEGVYEIMGLDKNLLELTLEDAWKFIHPDDLAKAQSVFFNSVNHKQPYFIEKRFVIDGGIIKHIRSSGKVHYNEYGKPEKFVGVFQDITREKMAEEALRFSEERWKYAIEGSNDGIWDWNLAENSIFLSDT